MKTRRIFCIAAVLCLLWTAAAADGYGNGYNYGTPVNIMSNSARPYYWESQARNGQNMTWGIENAFDGYWGTCMEHVCWNNESLDDIPEVTFYFHGATIKDVWFRNMRTSDSPDYRNWARLYLVEVTIWQGNAEEPTGTYRFNRLPDVCDSTLRTDSMYDGYQRLELPRRFENVTRVDLWIKGWYPGEGDRKTMYWLQIADLAFLPDSLLTLYGPWIYDTSYPNYTAVPAWYYTPTPTPVPQPPVTQPPYSGLQVITRERLATRSGPGTVYTELGSYYQSGTWVQAISSAYDKGNGIWWIQVELEYAGERRRVYTGVKRLHMNADQVPVETAEGAATLTRSVYAYWGPGTGYTMYPDKIPAGTSGTIWQREASYAQFEYYDTGSNLLRRVWVPENALESPNG